MPSRSDEILRISIAETLYCPNSISQFSKNRLWELYVLFLGPFDGAKEQTFEFNGKGGAGDMDLAFAISGNIDLLLAMLPPIFQHPLLDRNLRVFAVDSESEDDIHLASTITQPKANVGL